MTQQHLAEAPAVNSEKIVGEALIRYDHQYLRFKALAEEVYEICRELLRKNPTIQAGLKDALRRAKVLRKKSCIG